MFYSTAYGTSVTGHSYGVVTSHGSFKFQIYPATNNGQVTELNALFPGHLNASIWALSELFVSKLPQELTLDSSAG